MGTSDSKPAENKDSGNQGLAVHQEMVNVIKEKRGLQGDTNLLLTIMLVILVIILMTIILQKLVQSFRKSVLRAAQNTSRSLEV
jgi:uncharacterized membrane protein